MYAEDYSVNAATGSEVQAAATRGQYFESYGTDTAVTRIMLNDRPRMDFYRYALRPENVRGKIVVDVGAGTGVLSLFAARSGAAKVIAVEASDMSALLERNIDRFLEQTSAVPGVCRDVMVVEADAESLSLEKLRADAYLGPDELVDIIVSEWMGFYLLHECMLQSVLRFRDACFPSGGRRPLLLPGRCRILAAPVDLEPLLEHTVGRFWRDVDGIDLSAVGEIERAALLEANPLVHQLPPACMLCEPTVIWGTDCNTCSVDDLRYISAGAVFDFANSPLARAVLNRRRDAKLSGFALWFDVASFGVDDKNAARQPAPDAPIARQDLSLDPQYGALCAAAERAHREFGSCATADSRVARDFPCGDEVGASVPSHAMKLPISQIAAADAPRTHSAAVHPTVMPTGPCDPPTHWKQTVVMLPHDAADIPLAELASDSVGVHFTMGCVEAERRYDIGVELADPHELASLLSDPGKNLGT